MKSHCIRYIYLEDIMRFMGPDEALKAFHLFGAGSEEEGISKASLNNWLVICCLRFQFLRLYVQKRIKKHISFSRLMLSEIEKHLHCP